jgi:hypothetical protein
MIDLYSIYRISHLLSLFHIGGVSPPLREGFSWLSLEGDRGVNLKKGGVRRFSLLYQWVKLQTSFNFFQAA